MSQNTPPNPSWNPEHSAAGASASEVPGQQPEPVRPAQEPAPAPQQAPRQTPDQAPRQAPPTDPKLDGHSSGPGAGVWAALIVGIQPVLTAIWLSAMGGADGHVSRRQWFGLMLGFAGLVLVVMRKFGSGGAGDHADWINLSFAVLALLAPLVLGLEAVAAVMALCVVARTRASKSSVLGGAAH